MQWFGHFTLYIQYVYFSQLIFDEFVKKTYNFCRESVTLQGMISDSSDCHKPITGEDQKFK